ncbi:YhcN/YlaJ family sporulation lipoprotein [Alicyclobacillus sacchari]|uniref:YhcN/YlaJ family sporulation lipoprotein n=2 Tax=Alicyclobacillus sacchari TaxID=392010 RepID=A0A4R8LK72_9BACL|nr:YhcN/YlaJ family sporulation lipoprotein [Alicyclobacillus sacchari]TDY43456.1 YhcN/YlaJ family sporulation lipoprotein [Alicyclobacillus sacchari]
MKRIAQMLAVGLVGLSVAGCGTGKNTAPTGTDVFNATRQAGNTVANATGRAGQIADQGARDLANGAATATRRAGQAAADIGNRIPGVPANPQHANAVHMQIAQKISDDLVRSGYAKQAVTFVAGDTAYVALQQAHPATTNEGLKDKQAISHRVRRMNPQIRTVYVSANPDVYTRFQSFAKDLAAGRPVQAVWNNFQTSISRMFPTQS